MRHTAYVTAIVACGTLSVLSWYQSFAPGHPSSALFYVGIGFALVTVILVFLWRVPSA